MLTRRHTLAGLALLGAFASIGPAFAGDAPKEVKLGFQKGGPLQFLARRKGVIEARLKKEFGIESVKWVEFQFGPPMLEALGIGAIDIGPVGDTPPIFAQAAGANVVYAISTPAAQHGILVRKDSALKSIADLKGRKVAIPKGSSAHNFTVQALAANGLSFADIEAVYLTPADGSAAFASGKVDAWAIWDPYYALAEVKQNARALDGGEKVKLSNSFYLANTDFAKKYPKVLKAVLDEYAALSAWTGDHRKEFAEVTTEATGLPIEATTRAVDRAVIGFRPLSPDIVAQQQQIADTFLSFGLIPKAIVVKEAVWTPPQS